MVDRNRIIEVDKIGRFVVYGEAPYTVIELPNSDAKLWGYIIVSESLLIKTSLDVIGQFNAVYKLDNTNRPVAKLLVKSRDMADEICFACNRLRR
jgi:hypothetical protein